MLKDMEEGQTLHHWSLSPAPEDIKEYYNLPKNSTWKDII